MLGQQISQHKHTKNEEYSTSAGSYRKVVLRFYHIVKISSSLNQCCQSTDGGGGGAGADHLCRHGGCFIFLQAGIQLLLFRCLPVW